jgi:Na+/H+ antiporter NhaC
VAVVPMAALLMVFVGKLWLDGGGLARPASAVLRVSVWREVLGEIDSIPLLAYAGGVGFLLAVALAQTVARIPVAALARAVVAGVAGSWLPVSVLVLAWSLKGACTALQTGDFLAEALGGSLSPRVFPALVFVVAAVTSFATGTSWGTMAILIPTAIPVAFQLDGVSYGPVTTISVAAILDGAIFGDHCSPISDTTIMSSTASACDHLAHVRTQMPYSLVVAVLALCVGYLPTAAGVSKWVAAAGGAAFSGLLFLGLWARRRRQRPA